MKPRAIVCWALVLALSGCANALKQGEARRYHAEAMRAEAAGDYRESEQLYYQALVSAELGSATEPSVSMLKYNLGRVKGYVCRFDEADRLLREALELQQKLGDAESGLVGMRLFELARLHLDFGAAKDAATYFARAIPIAVKLGAEQSDPIGLADVWDDYARALERAGADTEGAGARQEANRLREANAGRTARFAPVRYERGLCDA